MNFSLAHGRITQDHLLYVDVSRFGWRFGRRREWRLFLGLCLPLSQRIEIAAAIGIFNDLHDWRIHRHLVDIDVASEDSSQMIAGMHLRSSQKRFGSGGLDFYIMQEHFREWMNRGIANRNGRIHRFAHSWKNNSLKES